MSLNPDEAHYESIMARTFVGIPLVAYCVEKLDIDEFSAFPQKRHLVKTTS
jgi:hypothetical protein